jgi:N-hydroxyarylamine O-acetyltransferase
MDVDAYLERIGYSSQREPTIEVLRGLLAAHRETVPWENLDIVRGKPISLDVDALFDKIVRRRRGGFCHELNQLFDALLCALGFQTTLLACESVTLIDGQVFPPFSHQLLLVTLASSWFLDVGFGARGPRAPLNLDDHGEQSDGVSRFRIDRSADGRYHLRHFFADAWRPIHDFTLEPRRPSDFAERCHQQQIEPTYSTQLMVTRTIPGGNVSLNGVRLITTRDGERTERELKTEDEVAEALRKVFGIEGDRET